MWGGGPTILVDGEDDDVKSEDLERTSFASLDEFNANVDVNDELLSSSPCTKPLALLPLGQSICISVTAAECRPNGHTAGTIF